MIRYWVERVFRVVVTLSVASFLVFASLYAAPGDPVDFLSQGRSLTPEATAALEQQYGLDEPFFTQYANWLGGVLSGDFGTSFQYREDVTVIIGARLGTTVLLMVMAAILITVTGLIAGIVGSLNAGRIADRSILVTTTLLAAVPSFVAAILLISVFGVKLGWFPTYGNGSGLFASNRFSPRHFALLLAAAYRDFRYGPDLVASLSIAGVVLKPNLSMYS